MLGIFPKLLILSEQINLRGFGHNVSDTLEESSSLTTDLIISDLAYRTFYLKISPGFCSWLFLPPCPSFVFFTKQEFLLSFCLVSNTIISTSLKQDMFVISVKCHHLFSIMTFQTHTIFFLRNVSLLLCL